MAVKDVGELRARLVLDKNALTTGLHSAQQEMGQFFRQVAGYAGIAATALKVLQETWQMFLEVGREETALNRVDAALVRMGISTYGVRQELLQLGNEFIRFGQQEMTAYTGFQQLAQATNDAARAQELLRLALRFSVATGQDVSAVAGALARAYGGQEMQLKRLLIAQGLATTELDNWRDAMVIMTGVAESANDILSQQEMAVNDLKAAWDNFGTAVGNVARGPLTAALTALRLMLEQPGLAFRGKWFEAWFESYLNQNFPIQEAGPGRREWEDWQRRRRGGGPKDPSAWIEETLKKLGSDRTAKDAEAEAKRLREERLRTLKEEWAFIEQTEAEALARSVEAWREANQWKIDGVRDLSSVISQQLVGSILEGKFSFEDFGRSILRVIANIIAQLIQLKIQMEAVALLTRLGWIGAMPTGGGWPGGGTPAPAPVGGIGAAGFGPPVPTGGGGGLNISIQPHPSGTLFKVLRGNRVEFQQLAEDTYLVGAQLAASR